jgi:hypothetical protein
MLDRCYLSMLSLCNHSVCIALMCDLAHGTLLCITLDADSATTATAVLCDKQALCTADHTEFLKLDGLPPEEVEELVVHEFGPNVASISDDLFKMIEILCLGNPFMIIELTAHLKVRCCCSTSVTLVLV